MKKVFCIIMFTMFAAVTFAQRNEHVYTSEGLYFSSIDYDGKYKGKQRVSDFHDVKFINTLSDGQWEVVNKRLSKYRCTTGDTFTISIGFVLPYDDFDIIFVIVEFTSNTQYQWWALRKM